MGEVGAVGPRKGGEEGPVEEEQPLQDAKPTG